jgi:hypothetical protein
MARTVVKPESSSGIVVWRLDRWGLALTIGSVVAALAFLAMTSVAAAAATGSCAITPRTSRNDNPDLVELQRLIETQARGSEPHGGEAVPEDDVGTEVERELGSQYGEEWYEVEAGDFAVGLVAGPISVPQATEKVRQVLARMIEPGQLAFAEAHVEVLSVPYSPAELTAAAASIQHELEEIGVSRGASTGQSVGEFDEPLSPGYWPQVSVIFDGYVTQTECEAAIPIFRKYGGEVSYRREEGVPSSGVLETPFEPAKPPGPSEEPSKPPTARDAPPQSMIVDARNGDDTLRALMRELARRSAQGLAPIKARMRLVLPESGRLLVRIWAVSGRTRKLVAVGVAPVHAGDGAIVVLVKRTAFGRQLHGKELHRISGEVSLLSRKGDTILAAQTDITQ